MRKPIRKRKKRSDNYEMENIMVKGGGREKWDEMR